MASVGINLRPYIKSKKLVIHSSRPSLSGLELHLLVLHRLIEENKPQTVIVDPLSSLASIGRFREVTDMLIRMVDMLKTNRINAFFTSLTDTGSRKDSIVDAVSSLADNWIHLNNEIKNNNHVRTFRIIKARGIGHETTEQQFIITSNGIQMLNTENKNTTRRK